MSEEDLRRAVLRAAGHPPVPRARWPSGYGRSCQVLAEQYDGQAATSGRTPRHGAAAEVGTGQAARLRSGQGGHLHRGAGQAAGVTPPGWREAAGCYGEPGSFARWPTSSTRTRCRRCGRPRGQPRRPRRRRPGLIRRSGRTVGAGVARRGGVEPAPRPRPAGSTASVSTGIGAVNGSRRCRSPPPAGKNRCPGVMISPVRRGRHRELGWTPDRPARPTRSDRRRAAPPATRGSSPGQPVHQLVAPRPQSGSAARTKIALARSSSSASTSCSVGRRPRSTRGPGSRPAVGPATCGARIQPIRSPPQNALLAEPMVIASSCRRRTAAAYGPVEVELDQRLVD